MSVLTTGLFIVCAINILLMAMIVHASGAARRQTKDFEATMEALIDVIDAYAEGRPAAAQKLMAEATGDPQEDRGGQVGQ